MGIGFSAQSGGRRQRAEAGEARKPCLRAGAVGPGKNYIGGPGGLPPGRGKILSERVGPLPLVPTLLRGNENGLSPFRRE